MQFARRRAPTRAWRILWPYLKVTVALYAMFSLAAALIYTGHGRNPSQPRDFALRPASLIFMFSGFPAGLAAAAAAMRYHKARWRPLGGARGRGRGRGSRLGRTADDDVVTIEGKVRGMADGERLVGPVSGAPCVYYRVRVEHHDGGAWTSRSGGWWKVRDGALLLPFTVSENGETIRLEPVVRRDEATAPNIFPVDIDFDLVDWATVSESDAGLKGLSDGARRHVESVAASMLEHWDNARLRVTELALHEGDDVVLVGHAKWQKEPVGAFRVEGAVRVGIMCGFPDTVRVAPATLRDLAWLRRFDITVLISLVFLSICSLSASVSIAMKFVRG